MAKTKAIHVDKSMTIEKAVRKLDKLAEKSESIIYEISSVFPFQIFPDKIIIDKNKVTVVRNQFFYKRAFPILIEDILTIKVNRGILFAAIEFEIAGYESNPRPVTHFWPEEAINAKKYILALIQVKKAGIDTTKLSTPQLREKLEEIGKAEEEVERLF